MMRALTRKSFFISSIVMLLCGASMGVYGQDMDALYQKYRNDQAVVTNMAEQLVIKNEHGQLTARSNVTRELLLIGELSPGLFNKDYIFESFFNQLKDYDAEVMAPGKNGYKKAGSVSSQTTVFKDDEVFFDDYKQTELTFSGLAPRSLLRTTYTIEHTNLHHLTPFYFQNNQPVAKATYEVTAPKYVNINFVIKGTHAGLVKQSRQENKNTVTYTFTAENLPPQKSLEYVPSSAWYALHIVPYITSYRMPGEDSTPMLNGPAGLYAYYYNFIRDIDTAEDAGVRDVVAAITAGDHTPLEKATHIYQWVQKNIHYIAFEDSLGGLIPRQAADICKRKFGDCKDMSSILYAMCRVAGIEAHFTWIGTRAKPYTYEETPVPLTDNHMICAIKPGNDWIFLDGTNPIIPFGCIPQSIQGKEALIGINEKQFVIVNVPVTDAASNRCVDSTVMQISDKKVSGTVSIALHGYPSWRMQILMMYSKYEDREKNVRSECSRGSNKFVQVKYDYSHSDTGYKDSRITSDFTIDDYVQQVGKDYIVNMNLTRYFEGNGIDTADRKIGAFFKYRDITREVAVLQVPPGFHVSYLPPADSGYLKDGWAYEIRYQVQGDKVILTKEYRLLSLEIKPRDFAMHNSMIDKLKKQYKESVVLTHD